jgi:hypothetical protein
MVALARPRPVSARIMNFFITVSPVGYCKEHKLLVSIEAPYDNYED